MDFWKSAGFHLVKRNNQGWLEVTDDYLRAYFTRPEIHPVDSSCASEHSIFEKLMENPRVAISESELENIVDKDAGENYRIILRFRDHLICHETVEKAYISLFSESVVIIPPVFIAQMVHLILRNVLDGTTDPMRLRAAELFFRDQIASVDTDQVMLADLEIVEMRGKTESAESMRALVPESDQAIEVELDILREENKSQYWQRSDNFDMSADCRFTQPVPDALGRVIEAWIFHFHKIKTRIQSMNSIQDEAWSWHIGCDHESMEILNALYDGEEVPESRLYNLLLLYKMEFLEPDDVKSIIRGKPVYLAVAMNDKKHVSFKPQNLLTNLPVSKS